MGRAGEGRKVVGWLAGGGRGRQGGKGVGRGVGSMVEVQNQMKCGTQGAERTATVQERGRSCG